MTEDNNPKGYSIGNEDDQDKKYNRLASYIFEETGVLPTIKQVDEIVAIVRHYFPSTPQVNY